MKKFLVNIRAYGYHARFIVEAEDTADSIENSIVDKTRRKRCKNGKKTDLLVRLENGLPMRRSLMQTLSDLLQAEKATGNWIGSSIILKRVDILSTWFRIDHKVRETNQ